MLVRIQKIQTGCLAIFVCLFVLGVAPVYAYKPAPLGSQQSAADPNSEEFEAIKIQDKLGESINIDTIQFKDEAGQLRPLADFFEDGKPVIVTMMYYGCPSLCGLVLNGVTSALRKIEWNLGEEYKMLTISIDPTEGPELATLKKENYIKDYGRPESQAAKGWSFLTGDEANIKKLAEQIGFGYRYVEDTREYAHSAGFFILTPKGEVSRVLYGAQYNPRDVKLALLEASDGEIGSFTDRVLLFCYRYDPNSRGYALYAFRIMQAGGAATALIMGFFLFGFWRRQT